MIQKSVTFGWGTSPHGFPIRALTGCRRTIPFLFLALLSLLISPSAPAQTTATLSGTVQDQTGGVIPGAQVTLTNQETNDSRVVQTNATGLYAFPALTPGI